MVTLRLESLPAELIHEIVPLLVFTTVCNLRLSNKQISRSVADCPSFQAHFARKTVSLNEIGLRSFLYMTERSWLPCQIQHLTLLATLEDAITVSTEPGFIDHDGDSTMGEAPDTSFSRPWSLQVYHQPPELAEWLTFALSNIRKKVKSARPIQICVSLDRPSLDWPSRVGGSSWLAT